jgi:hypothetical protein
MFTSDFSVRHPRKTGATVCWVAPQVGPKSLRPLAPLAIHMHPPHEHRSCRDVAAASSPARGHARLDPHQRAALAKRFKAGSRAMSPEVNVELARFVPCGVTYHEITRDHKIVR